MHAIIFGLKPLARMLCFCHEPPRPQRLPFLHSPRSAGRKFANLTNAMTLFNTQWIPHIVDVFIDNAGIRITILEYLSSDHRRLVLFAAVERQLSVFLREEAAEIRGSYLALLDLQRDSQIYSSHSSLDSCSSVSDHLMMDIELGDLSDRSG